MELNHNIVKQSFPILHMSCASCANNVEETLQKSMGVLHASVNYATQTAQVEFDSTLTQAKTLKQAVIQVGYDLVIEEEAQEKVEELHEQAYQALRFKTIGALVFSTPLVVVAMFFMHMPYGNYIMWALSTPVILYFGQQFFIGAYKQLKHGSANMDSLVALSTGIAYSYSVFNVLYPEFWHGRGLHPHVYFESAAVVIAFILLGKLLEEKAKGNTSSAIKKLMGMQPKSVTLQLPHGETQEIPIAQLNVGDMVVVKPGEKIAVDGLVVSGSSYVDESMISGEPLAVEKKKDSQVYAGTMNQKGSFLFKAQKVGGDTLLAQIIRMVQDAQGSKAPVQKLVDKIAGVFVPVVMLIALFSFVVWYVWGGEQGFTHGLMAMVTVLVIACPCALGLATPTAIMVGVGKGAEKGILIKDAESLENAKNISAIILDKTGTITEGKPQVVAELWLKSDMHFKNILWNIEKRSEHPLAEAVIAHMPPMNEDMNELHIENQSGQGIQGAYQNKTYWIGNEHLMQEHGIGFNHETQAWANEQFSKAYTVIYFAHEQGLIAAMAIADQIKTTSALAVQQLQAKGITVYMLTGDNAHSAKAVCDQVGITSFKANVLPADKAAFVKNLQAQGEVVAMVGDGINDSNALAQADVSIAMGKGSDVAMDVAKMTIISSDLLKIADAIQLSKQTVKTVKQNLFWAFIYNVIGIPLAAGILYPINGFLLDPMIAGAAMALSSVSVVSNSLLLKWRS
jgi:Cu2+-exporting ATPase